MNMQTVCTHCQAPTRLDDPGGRWVGLFQDATNARWICASCAFWLEIDGRLPKTPEVLDAQDTQTK